MITRLKRQRRRLLWLAFCLCLAGVYRMGPVPEVLGVALVGTAMGIVALWLAPQRRTWIECAGISLALCALLPLPTVALLFIAPLMAMLMNRALYGQWWDKSRLRFALKSRQTARLDATPGGVWHALIPGESHPDDHWSGTLIDFDTDPDDELTLYLEHDSRNGLAEEMTVTFLNKQRPAHCEYMLERQSGNFTDEAEVSITLAPLGTHQTKLSSQLRNSSLPLRLALHRWFDDAMGDEFDSLTASLSRTRDWSITGLSRQTATAQEGRMRWAQKWPEYPQAMSAPFAGRQSQA